MILRYHHKHHKPLFVASLDIAKAFDLVAYDTISETLEVMGLLAPMISYIMHTYKHSTTRLCCNSWTSEKIGPS